MQTDGIIETWESAPTADQLLKSVAADAARREQMKPPKSALIDPYNAYGVGGTRSRDTVVSYTLLRAMAKVAPVAAILTTRLNQVARYARRPRFDGDIGFKIVLKDKGTKMTEAQRKRAFELEEFFLRTGSVPNRKRRDNFDTFLRKLVNDSLVLDCLTFEMVPNLKGELAELWAIDAATIELVTAQDMGEDADPVVYEPMTRAGMEANPEDLAYVQRVNGEIRAEFTEDELAYAVRNPRTDLLVSDFGMSELEVLIEIVTGILNGIRYNTTYFTANNLPQGILSIIGNYEDEHLEGFKRHWTQMTSGAAGKWATPVMAMSEGQGMQWTPFKQSNQDMQFNEFLEFLFNIACAVYQIDPNEVGFKSWTSNSGAMGQSDNTAEKISQSKDKGFVPLMYFLSNTFNHEVMHQLDPDYEFTWVGVDEEDEDRKLERQSKQAEMGLVTVAELRKADDREELINPATGKPWLWTMAPANPQLIQVFMSESGQGQPGQDPNADPNDPKAQAEAAQQADDQHGKQQEMADDGHEKKLEVMDKQHEQNMEAKEADQAHQIKMAKMHAENQAKAAKSAPKPGEKLKKGLDADPVEIVFNWREY